MQSRQDRIAIYSRKSRFTGKGESVGNQVELCRAHIRAVYGAGCAEDALVFEDEGFSGGNLNRPAFQRMMELARRRRFRAVVVYRLDRVSRSIGDFAALIQELGRLEIDFISIRERFDTSSPMGRAMMYIASVFSQLERETIAERIRDNMRELAKTGRWLGGVTPLGFASEAVGRLTEEGKSKRACRLRPVPEEADIVRRIFRLYLETGSLTAAEGALGEAGLRTRAGRAFTRYSIRAILQNPVYLTADGAARRYFTRRGAEVCAPPEAFDGTRGVLAYNRTEQEKGRTTAHLPVERWIVSVGEHPGLIPSGQWLRAQQLLEGNRSRAGSRSEGSPALLSGLLWCRCGSRMYPKQARRASGERTYTYFCRGEGCAIPGAAGGALDAAVLAGLAELPMDGARFRARLEEAARLFREEDPPAGAEGDLPRLAGPWAALEALEWERRREAVGRLVRRVEWDGRRARVVLWGSDREDSK